MATTRHAMRAVFFAAAGASLITADLDCARAQVGSYGGPAGPQMQAPPTPGATQANVFAPSSRPEHALIVGDWLLYPSALAAAMYDSNPNQSPTNVQSGAGLRLVPSVVAERTSGISKTSVYGMVDGQIYPGQPAVTNNAVAARLGATEDYQPLSDWLFHAHLDYTRQRDLFSAFGTSPTGHLVIPLNPTAIGLEPVANPVAYNQLSAEGVVQKRFGNAFTQLGGSVFDIIYDNSGGVTSSPNGAVYTGVGRSGIWFTPDFYGYLELAGDSRNFDTSALSSTGYRTVAGIGSHRIGLFRGEIFAGYQAEDYNSSAIGTVSSAVYGGILHYYPLPELTLDIGVNTALGASLLAPTPTSPVGTATQVSYFLADAAYKLAPEWTASAHLGYIHTDYVGSVRRDNGWTVEPTITYSVWQNFGITFDYQHIEMNSNVPLAGFSRDVITVGLSYQY